MLLNPLNGKIVDFKIELPYQVNRNRLFGHCLVSIGGDKLFLSTGISGSQFLLDSNDQWKSLPPTNCTSPKFDQCVMRRNEIILHTQSEITTCTSIFDIEAQKWKHLSMKNTLTEGKLIVANEEVYFIEGKSQCESNLYLLKDKAWIHMDQVSLPFRATLVSPVFPVSRDFCTGQGRFRAASFTNEELYCQEYESYNENES